MLVAVGSTNRAKIASVEQALNVAFPDASKEGITVKGVNAVSGVRDQPLSDDETMQGAIARAHFALKEVPESDFGIGIEGGIQKVGEKWFESGWVVVVDRNGKMGMGTSARYEISGKIMNRIFAGQELADIMDDMTGTRDVRHNSGAMGVLTKGILNRDLCYTHGIFFAFAPWLSDEMFWK